jgi:hypothetical protein
MCNNMIMYHIDVFIVNAFNGRSNPGEKIPWIPFPFLEGFLILASLNVNFSAFFLVFYTDSDFDQPFCSKRLHFAEITIRQKVPHSTDFIKIISFKDNVFRNIGIAWLECCC